MPFTFKNSKKAVAVFILLGVFLLLAILILIGRGSEIFAMKTEYYILLNEGYGLSSGAGIRHKGIAIGKVGKMELTKEGKVRVEITILDEYKYLIKKNSVIKASSALFGAASLVLITHEGGYDEPLEPGDMILSSDMSEGQDIILEISESAPKTDDIMENAKDILNMVLDLKPVLNTTMINLRDITADIKKITGGLTGEGPRTLTSDKLLAMLDKTEKIIDSILIIIKAEALNIDTILSSSGNLLKNFDALTTKGGVLDSILKNVDTMTAKNGSLDKLVKELLSLTDYLFETLETLNGILPKNKEVEKMMASLNYTLKNVEKMTDDFKKMTDKDNLQKTILLLNENLMELKKTIRTLPDSFIGGLIIGGDKKPADTTLKSGDR